MRISDWSSDVCSSDLALLARVRAADPALPAVDEGEDADTLSTLRAFCTSVFEQFVKDRLRQRLFGIVMQGREALAELEPLANERREEICRSAHVYQRSEEHTSELQSLMRISYAVFCLKKKTQKPH